MSRSLDRAADALHMDARGFSRAALRARGKVRAQGGGDLVALMREGEKAAQRGQPESANPHPVGTEEFELWLEGYQDIING